MTDHLIEPDGDGYTRDADGNIIPDPQATGTKLAKGRALFEKTHSPSKQKQPSTAVAALIKRFPHSRH